MTQQFLGKLASVLGVGLALLACAPASHLQRGVNDFSEGRYADAAVSLRTALSESKDTDDGRLWLYLGLTHLALGNAGQALLNLQSARGALHSRPDQFSRSERCALESAWSALGMRPGQSPAEAENGSARGTQNTVR